jgi:hypothetical protein
MEVFNRGNDHVKSRALEVTAVMWRCISSIDLLATDSHECEAGALSVAGVTRLVNTSRCRLVAHADPHEPNRDVDADNAAPPFSHGHV